jgi:hypothetical protein
MSPQLLQAQRHVAACMLLATLTLGGKTVQASEVVHKVPASCGVVREDKNDLVLCVSFKLPTCLSLAQQESVISANSQLEFLDAIAKYLQIGANCKLSLQGANYVRQHVDQTNNLCTVNWRVPKIGVQVLSIKSPDDGKNDPLKHQVPQKELHNSYVWRHNFQDYEAELGRLKEKVRASLESMRTQAEPEYGLAIESLGEWAAKTISEVADEAGRNPRLLKEERRLIFERIQELGEVIKLQIKQGGCNYE